MTSKTEPIREFVTLKSHPDKAVLLEVHCVPCKVGENEERVTNWMNQDLWSSVINLVEPVIREGLVSGNEIKSGTVNSNEVLSVATAWRKCGFESGKIVPLNPVSTLILHGQRLVVSVALKSDQDDLEVNKRLHETVGLDFNAEDISRYFKKA